ncbi:hypothetical protein LC082_03420 [Microbacterium esteraromaticum]|uniref:N-acetylglucosamine kinase n=1 Tax=Microbacterium esteraromaticum TaxID=57043 RepID=UPI001CD75C04|nr:BadF/BadG/BcrA/BcrD ATPase family protein [Microbacterium esteraromaticum]MCA1305950.1 hypothetical protein [Microbacterium esteraromaticum]
MNHEPLFIGLDAGGTSTRALLTDASGNCLGYGVGGRGNPISAGPALAADGVLAAIDAALAPTGRTLADVTVVVAAMAGMRAAGGDAWLKDRLIERGFSGVLSFEADLLAAYFSGTASTFGYALVSGTGACVIRVQDGRIDGAADGLGWLLGDRGSGFWIGQAIARAVVQDLDGTGPRTRLTEHLLARHGLARTTTRHNGRSPELEQIIGVLYSHPPIDLAGLAPLAFDDPDDVALGILTAAGESLADTLAAVLTDPGPLVIGGSVLAQPGPLRNAFLARLGDRAEQVQMRSVSDGAVGAAMLAVRASGGRPDEDMLTRLTDTLTAFR